MGKGLKKRTVVLLFSIVAIVAIVNLSMTASSETIACSTGEQGVVSKVTGDEFVIAVTFKNIGKSEGNWAITPVFEGEFWNWKGTLEILNLGVGGTKTLKWTGIVPDDATTNSMARLVVYYNDSFKALNWWIRVVPGAELSVVSSTVE